MKTPDELKQKLYDILSGWNECYPTCTHGTLVTEIMNLITQREQQAVDDLYEMTVKYDKAIDKVTSLGAELSILKRNQKQTK